MEESPLKMFVVHAKHGGLYLTLVPADLTAAQIEAAFAELGIVAETRQGNLRLANNQRECGGCQPAVSRPELTSLVDRFNHVQEPTILPHRHRQSPEP